MKRMELVNMAWWPAADSGGGTLDHIIINCYRSHPEAAHVTGPRCLLRFVSRDLGNGMWRMIDCYETQAGEDIRYVDKLLKLPLMGGPRGQHGQTEMIVDLPDTGRLSVSCWYKDMKINVGATPENPAGSQAHWNRMYVDGHGAWPVYNLQPGDLVCVIWPVESPR
jgi:hypothetical protein